MYNKSGSSDNTATDTLRLNQISDVPEIVSVYDTPFTKFLIPSSNSQLIDRKNFDSRITTAVKKKLIILAAPAGYGKSTIISNWALKNKKDNKNIIWIALDKVDGEESSFWHNVLYAIGHNENIIPYHRISAFSTEQCINLIINYFSGIPSECFIVFDDFHNVDFNSIRKSFEYFLSYLSENLHCIIMSRTFPSFSISKMILDEDVIVFNSEDLKFSHEEIILFLNEIMDLNLSEEDVKSLQVKTEGWIAALKVAALSLKKCSDKKTCINNFGSNNPKILRYMLEEVIYSLEVPVREFLIKTSILMSLNKSICKALTGFDDSQEILETLDTNNFFITSLDDRKESYRYHQLLSEILIGLLHKEYADQVNELYLVASRWHEDRCFYRDALEYSSNSMSPRNTLKLLRKYYSKAQSDILAPKNICNYFETIPCEMYSDMPDLCIRYAQALAETGQIDIGEKILSNHGIYLDDDIYKSYKGKINQLRAYIALRYENIAEVINYSEQALWQLPENDISYVTLSLILGYIYRSLGILKKAETCFNNALSVSNIVNKISPGKALESYILSNFYITSIQYLKGELDDFIMPLNQMLTENITHKNCMYFCLAATYYDCGDFQQAYSNVMKGLELCNTYDDIFYEKVRGLVLLARILFFTGESVRAVQVMNEIDSLIKPNCGNMFILLELPDIISLLILLGFPERAETYLNNFKDYSCKEAEFTICEAKAELFLAKNDYKQAIDQLDFIFTNMDLSVYPKKRIDLLVMKSVAFKELGNDDDALECLQKALEVDNVERYVRSFADRGTPVYELTLKFINSTKRKNEHLFFAEDLVKRFKNRVILKIHSAEKSTALSYRELEVLKLLAHGLSYKEIGKALYISLSTVKKHAGNIYYKLNAGNRIQAINIAKSNGLVD